MPRDIIITPEDKLADFSDPPVSITAKHHLAVLSAREQGGVFITCGKTVPNVMSTHWIGLGAFWNRPVFILPVKKSKMTHHIVSETKCFAVSVPFKDMRNEIMACDHLSGFDVNKFNELHLHPARANKIPAYTIAECGLFFECRVIYEADTTDGQIDPALKHEMYGDDNNYHTMYFAEIIDVYEKTDESVPFSPKD